MDHSFYINFTSNDIQLINVYRRILGLEVKIGKKKGASGTRSNVLQFKSRQLHDFFIGIGIVPRKSRILGKIKVPAEYFFHFLRGVFDGDGSVYSYMDPRWRSSFMFYMSICSASRNFINWVREEVGLRLKIRGHISENKKNIVVQLKYAKSDSLTLMKELYRDSSDNCLERKKLKIKKILDTIDKSDILA